LGETKAATSAKRFYAKALDESEKADFPVALEVEGMDQEIALLRLRLRTALEQRPEDLPLMLRGVGMLIRALSAKYRLPKADQESLAEAFSSEIEGELWPRGGSDEQQHD